MAQREGKPDRTLTYRVSTRVAELCAAPMRKLGLTSREPIGCGAYGCVFPARRGVVKLVNEDSRDEVSASLWLLGQGARAPEAFPRIYGVYQLGACAGARVAFAIHREDVFDLPDEWLKEAREGQSRLKDTTIGATIFSALWNIENAGANAFGSCDVAAENMAQFVDHYASEYPALRPLLKAAARLQRWGCEQGIAILDTHPLNWGRRKDGTFVLRDFGGTSSDEGQSFRQDRYAPGEAAQLGRLTAREGRVVFAGLVGW